MPFFYTDSGSFNILEVSESTILSGSLIVSGATNFGPTGLTGSVLGSSSFATTASAATSITFVPSTSSFATTASAATSITFTPTSASFATTSSAATSITFTPNSASFSTTSSAATSITFTPSSASFASTASFVNALTNLTASNVQLNSLADTTSANKVLVLDTTTNKIFTTASVGTGGSSPAGTAFPFSGSAVITGSLYVTSSVANPVTITGSINDFFELEIVNANAGNAASADIVASNDLTTDVGNYIDMGINSSTYAGTLVGGPSDGYLYFTSSVGELHVGNASTGGTANIRLFAGGPSSDALTRVFISSSGNVGVGTVTPDAKLTVAGIVSASSYTSSFNNQVGYFGTSSFAVSSSQAISASFARTAISASYFSGSATFPDGLTVTSLTASVAQLTGLTDTTSANKVLVLDTTTNKIFTTASVGTGGGGSGTGFPFSGSAIITGSMIVSSSGIQIIGNGVTGSVFSGSFFNIIELSMAVSGTIAANGTTTVTLDLNKHNYFSVSASAVGTVTWTLLNTPPTGRAQTFVIEYTNGGIKTNSWFTNTRWPAGVAPTLTSASANPDILSFTTDDAGANWRGLLLQRGSA